jgi:benzoyl-CoA reductase subunit C
MMEMFKEWYDARHEYAKEWKEKTGGKVMGYFCTYVPEEILLAADVLPVRILGSHEPQDVTEPHIFGMFCPFCRDCLAQGLKGRYDYLDGIMISQSCLHIRQAYTSWEMHIPTPFNYYLPMPHHVQSPRALPYLRGELENFKKAVEEWTGKTITNEDLDRGIEIMNRHRKLMREAYDTRKQADPPMSGLEAMYMAV